MTGRIVRTELLRSTALWAGLLVAGIDLAFLYSVYNKGPMWDTGVSWNEQWTALAVWPRFLLVLVIPAVLGAGAVLGTREHRSTMTELLATVPRPRRLRVLPTMAAMAVSLIAGYLAVVVLGAAQVAGNGSLVSFRWVPIMLVGLLAVVAVGWFGMSLGRSLPSAVTPPLAAGISLVVVVGLFLSTSGSKARDTDTVPSWLRLLSPVLDELRNPWETVTGRVTLGQFAWLSGLAGTAFLLLVAHRRRTRLLAVVPVAVGLVIAVALFPARYAQAYTIDEKAAELVCADGVCLTALHAALLPELEGPGREALRKLSVLPDPPTRIEERVGELFADEVASPSATTLYLDFARWRSSDDVQRMLLLGAVKPSCEPQDPADRAARKGQSAAREIAAAWLAGAPKPMPMAHLPGGGSSRDDEVAAQLDPAWDALHAVSRDEQRDRVAAMRTAALTCDGDLLTILSEGTGAGR